MTAAHPSTIRRIALIEAAISDKSLTYKEIAKATFTSEPYTLRCMSSLRKQGLVHVAEWQLCSRVYAAAYRWGAGVDAPRPKPITAVEWWRAERKRIRLDPVENAFYLARIRAKDQVRRLVKRGPQGWASALFVGVRLPLNGEG